MEKKKLANAYKEQLLWRKSNFLKSSTKNARAWTAYSSHQIYILLYGAMWFFSQKGTHIIDYWTTRYILISLCALVATVRKWLLDKEHIGSIDNIFCGCWRCCQIIFPFYHFPSTRGPCSTNWAGKFSRSSFMSVCVTRIMKIILPNLKKKPFHSPPWMSIAWQLLWVMRSCLPRKNIYGLR